MKMRSILKRMHSKQLLSATFLVLSGLVLLQGCADKSAVQPFRFVFMTDIHVQPELRADEGFRAAVAKVNELNPDFVITGGDLIMDALEQNFERATKLYELYINICEEFEMPVYHTIGNHEVFGLYKESGIDPNHPEYGKKMFKNRLGNNKTYFSFDHKNWHFILLDAVGFTADRQYIGEFDSLQLEWLKNDLKKVDKKTPIVVSTHIPFVSAMEQMRKGGTAALSPGAVVVNSNEALAMFIGYNLKLVLQGHLHIVEEIVFHDIHFVTGGAVSGNWWKGSRAGFPEGFVVVDVKDNDFTWQYQTFGWKAVEEE